MNNLRNSPGAEVPPAYCWKQVGALENDEAARDPFELILDLGGEKLSIEEFPEDLGLAAVGIEHVIGFVGQARGDELDSPDGQGITFLIAFVAKSDLRSPLDGARAVEVTTK